MNAGRLFRSTPLAALLCVAAAAPASARDDRYLGDFEFVRKTVSANGAAIRTKRIDWDAECDRLKPKFAAAKSDAEHVRNVMELLACVRDSHTDVRRTSVDWKDLPSKWDGLYGGGLWFGWDEGKFVLRGVMKGHPSAQRIPLGSVLVAIGEEPAWFAMERERRRIARFGGISSNHALFASLGNRMLPFGEKQEVELVFLTPESKTEKVGVPRWGPGGKAFYPDEALLPEGIATKEGAYSGFLKGAWSDKVGYLKITGGMDRETVAAFHTAFDGLKGMEALLLDCRGMGGGGDGEAWEMAGRFFPKGAANGRHGRIEPSGSWQFDGPVVMLQDEIEVSSAETFTWAVSETERVVSVGRPTGGWGIIPNVFKCPSGLVDFRLGVNARPTPIKGVQTEGVGWPPDVLLSFGPIWSAKPDPARELGLAALRLMDAGANFEEARNAFNDFAGGADARFRALAKKYGAKLKGFDADQLAKDAVADLRQEIAMEEALLKGDGRETPDMLGVGRRLESLSKRAKAAGLAKEIKKLEDGVRAAKTEADAQADLLQALGPSFTLEAKQTDAVIGKHSKSRTARWYRERSPAK